MICGFKAASEWFNVNICQQAHVKIKQPQGTIGDCDIRSIDYGLGHVPPFCKAALMSPIEIEEQLSKLAAAPFDSAEFPYLFLEALGRKATEIKSLKTGKSNKSDMGGVLQRNNVHIIVTDTDGLEDALRQLSESKATTKNKAHFIIATDGETFVAENLKTAEQLVCEFAKLGDEFMFFLPLAGIYFTAEIKNQAVDVKATARLNRLYMELLRENPDWDSVERRHDLNQFMARLIFCFFAEDTGIFLGENQFTNTLKKMSDSASGNVSEIIFELFSVMDTPPTVEARKGLPLWKDQFPHVNGGLFAGNRDVPKFSRIARAHLIAAGELDWSKINPDIFGSMIQAVADDAERGSLGMHYTSVPNILKVLNPLFLDDLREKLEEAGDNNRKLLNLRKRISNIRVFDPACGSGNFLVIAYKELRKIEAKILDRRGDKNRNTVISLENFYGIEIKDFAAQIAQIALLIAEFQCDVLYINQVQACKNMLPLDKANNIVIGNALLLDWLEVCPPTAPVDMVTDTDDDLFDTPLERTEINLDEDNLGGETYICGNPPYLGSTWQSKEQKEDLKAIFDGRTKKWKSLDYVVGWLMKAADYGTQTNTVSAFVTTNSICQGQQVPILWPLIFDQNREIGFAHTSFKWNNLASHNAGVTVVIVGLREMSNHQAKLFEVGDGEKSPFKIVKNVNPYLVSAENVLVLPSKNAVSNLHKMTYGNKPVDGGNLIVGRDDVGQFQIEERRYFKELYGSHDFINGDYRYCIWIEDKNLPNVQSMQNIMNRIKSVEKTRLSSRDKSANDLAKRSHQFRDFYSANEYSFIIPRHSSENREYLPIGFLGAKAIISDSAFALYDAPLWNMAIIASKLHLVWIATVCGKLETRYRYSNTLGWNTFPVPNLTDENKADLSRCAENILLARAAHFPKTIADLYKPEEMPDDLRTAHDRNDETLERIYIGRRFKTDTERLETLFDLYTKMTSKPREKKARA